MFRALVPIETRARGTCETTQTRRHDARRDHLTRRARDMWRVLALVRVRLASQAACSCKRKPIRQAALDGAALTIVGAINCAFMRVLYAPRKDEGAKFHHDAPRSTVFHVRDVRPAASLPSLVRSRERGRSLRRVLPPAQRTFPAGATRFHALVKVGARDRTE
jgi:hypothetical protein